MANETGSLQSRRYYWLYSAIGYAVAQLIILILWLTGLNRIGDASSVNDYVWTVMGLALMLTIVPGLVVGVFDGVARASGEPAYRFAVSFCLVAPLGLWSALVGSFAIGSAAQYCPLFESRCPPPPGLGTHLLGLGVTETALFVALIMAWLTNRLARNGESSAAVSSSKLPRSGSIQQGRGVIDEE